MSSNFCEEHHQLSHSQPLFSTKTTTFQEINVPPRKLFNKSKHEIFGGEEIEDIEEEEEIDPYSSDEFRIYEFKIRPCMRSRSHDWTDCPFAHPGEKARRRDPRQFHYSGNACADFRRGSCPRGDSCEFAHGVFECWLHPARYRTQACKDGKNCTRKVCFFAHTPNQLRVLPLSSESQSSSPSISIPKHCCSFCHSIASSSPTSTLMGLSHLSPPISRSSNKDELRSNGYSLLSRFNEASMSSSKRSLSGYFSYKNALMELMSSLEAMDLNSIDGNLSWGDQEQFYLSPSPKMSKSKDIFNEDGGPDIEWVNELVM